MIITVNKCQYCGAIFEDEDRYQKHVADEQAKKAFLKRHPKVKDDNCRFANGGWSVQRSEKWLKKYKADILKIVGDMETTPFGYGWFRYLDNGGDMFYGIACRILNVCPTCFREWGQGYYANNCNHTDKLKGKK